MRLPNQSVGVNRSAGVGSREGQAVGPDQGVRAQRIKLREVRCDCDLRTDICVCDNGRVIHMTLGEL
jgi:hypothetical protein